MVISNKITGNYSPYNLTRSNNTPRVKKFEEVVKQEQNTQNQSVSSEEEKYFMKVYPKQKQEVSEYFSYEKNGNLNKIALGTMFDRRG